jgi:hypothetical protein
MNISFVADVTLATEDIDHKCLKDSNRMFKEGKASNKSAVINQSNFSILAVSQPFK